VQLRAKTPDKKTLKELDTVSVRPALTGHLSLSADPPQAVLGETEAITLTVTLVGEATPSTAEELSVRVSAGAVQDLSHMGDGRFTARYLPPSGGDRQLALLTVSDRRDPSRIYGAACIPLVASAQQRVRTKPNSSVLLKVAGREFGPVQADRSGRATVPALLPPGPKTATLVTVTDGVPEESQLDLPSAQRTLVQWIPGHTGLPADSALSIPVRVAVFAPDGQRDAGAALKLTASAGTFSAPRHEGDGIYLSEYTPQTANKEQDVTLTAALEGSDTDRDTLKVTLIPTRPRRVSLTAEPSPLPLGAKAVTLTARVEDLDGAGLSGRTLGITPTGAKRVDPIRDQKDGSYTVDLAVIGRGAVEVWATAESTATGTPLRDLVGVPNRDRLPAAGISSAMLTLLALDEFGYPVPGVPVAVTVDVGDGAIPAEVTTNTSGVAQVYYTAGRSPHVVRIRATARDRSAAVNLMQVPPEVPELDLPTSGSQATVALIQGWQSIVTGLTIPRK